MDNISFTGMRGFNPHMGCEHGFKLNMPDFGTKRSQHGDKQLNQILADRLNSALKKAGLGATQLPGSKEFSPEEVANRILTHIKDAVSDISDPKQYKNKLKEAHRGIEKGIRDARKELKHLGLKNKEINQTIRDTRKLLHEGLKELRKNGPTVDSPVISTAISETSIQESSQHMESFSLEVLTQDGDIVRLSFENKQRERLWTFN